MRHTLPLKIGFWLCAILLVMTPRLTDLDIFFARDELTIWGWVDEFAQAIHAGDLSGTLTESDYPGIPMFWVQTASLTLKQLSTPFDWADLSAHHTLPLLAERRWAAGFFNALQTLLIIGLTLRLLGWRVAPIAAILLALDPFSLTEARLLRLETISANFVCLSLLAYFISRDPPHQRRWLIASGLLAGCAISAKSSALLMLPFIGLWWLIQGLWPPKTINLSRLQPIIIMALLWLGALTVAFGLIWPAMWIAPIEALQHVFVRGFAQATESSVWHGEVFFWGDLHWQDPGLFFYPVVFAFRTTPLVWVGLLGVIGLSIQRGKLADRWATIALYLFLFVALISLELSLIISKVDRFLILVFGPLCLLSSIGLAWLITIIEQKQSRLKPTMLWSSATLAILIAQLMLTMPVHPHYFTYWNPLLGGGRTAMNLLPMGSGEGVDEAMAYLNAMPGAESKILVCGGSRPWCEGTFQGESWRSATYSSGEWFQADYASLYISHLQRQTYPPAIVNFLQQQPPLYEVTMQGATYMSVYAVPHVDFFAGKENDLTGLARLFGYSFESQTIPQHESLTLEVWWENRGAGVDKLELRWLDEQGYLWGSAPVVPHNAYVDNPAEHQAVVSGDVTLPIPADTPPGTYRLELGVVGIPAGFAMPAGGDTFTVTANPTAPPAPLPPQLEGAPQSLTPALDLLGYQPPAPLNATESAWLTLYWQANQPLTDDLTLELTLVDTNGQPLHTWSVQPSTGHDPLSSWPLNRPIKTVWPLTVPPELPLGAYTLHLNHAGESRLTLPVEVWSAPLAFEIPPMQQSLNSPLHEHLTLLGYDLFVDVTGEQTALSPTFYWQSQSEMNQRYTLHLALYQADNPQAIATWPVPLADSKEAWKTDEVVITPYQFPVQLLPNEAYHLEVRLEPGQATIINDIQTQIVTRIH